MKRGDNKMPRNKKIQEENKKLDELEKEKLEEEEAKKRVEEVKKAKEKIEKERKEKEQEKEKNLKKEKVEIIESDIEDFSGLNVSEDEEETGSKEGEKEDKEVIKKSKKGNVKDKKKNKKTAMIVTIVVVVILLLLGAPALFIASKLSLMEKVDVNENDLGINEDVNKINEHIEEDITQKEMKQIKNILLLGSDTRSATTSAAGRSDTMILLSVNPIKNSIKLISIPRDSYVNINGRMDKLNHAYAYGGEQLLIKTINSTFNLNIKDFVTVNFANLAKIIDVVGGVEVEISEEERQFINSASTESYRISGKRYKRVNNAGKVILDGPQAVAYARDRKHGSDFARQMRQQNVIKSVIAKVTTLPMNKVMELIDVCLKQVRTNANVMEYTPLLADMLKERDQYMQNITQVQIPDPSFGKGAKINGVYYFTFSDAEAQKRFAETIYAK